MRRGLAYMTGVDPDGRPAAWLTFVFSAAPTVLGIVAFGYWLVSNQNQQALTAHDFSTFQQTVAMQFADLRGRLDDIHTSISTIPDQRAQIVEIQRRLDQNDVLLQNRVKVLDAMQEAAIRNRSDLDGLRHDVDALLSEDRQSTRSR